MAAEVITVARAGDVVVARQAAHALAATLGFDATAREEIALVVGELATNLIAHAHGGQFVLSSLADGERRGVRIESRDSGPGIADVEQAFTDGFSTGGSLGYGLGTVLRLSDTCVVTSELGQGTQIVATRWRRPAALSVARFPLDVGVATRPYPGLTANGDTFVVRKRGASLLTGVIDGLGHGDLAQQAAETARQFVESHDDQPLVEIFRGVALVCRATRGVVMALARFELRPPARVDDGATPGSTGSLAPQSALHLSFASIGNVEARVFHAATSVNLPVRRGVLGGVAPGPLVVEHAWDPRGVLVLHSDGLSTRWQWRDIPDLDAQPATIVAQRLLRALAKETDDATVLVITEQGAGQRRGP